MSSAIICALGTWPSTCPRSSSPSAIAILLAAMLSPVTNRLRKLGAPARRRHRDHGAGRPAADRRRADPDRHPDRVAGDRRLSSNVVDGFNKLVDWLQNGPLHVSVGLVQSRRVGHADPELPAGQPGHHHDVRRRDREPRSGTSWPASRSCCSRSSTSSTRAGGSSRFLLKFIPRARPGPGRPCGAAGAGPRCRTTSGPRSWSPCPTRSAS